MEPTLTIKMLGEFEVCLKGNPVKLPPSKKTRALLCYLVMADRPVRRERICELLWDIPDDPRGALRWSLSRLRSVLDDADGDWILADRETVAFSREGANVDALNLIAATSQPLSEMSTQDLCELTEEIRGPFLEGVEMSNCPEFQAWILSQRQLVQSASTKLLNELVSRLQDRPEDALPYAQRRAALDPLDEQAQASVVSLLAAAGRKREAEKQYQISVIILEAGGIPETGILRQALAQTRQLPQERQVVAPTPSGDDFLTQEIRFCTAADGTRIAYSTVGEGPPILKTANWLNHLEYDWESPVWRHVMRFLTKDRTLVRYDERGNGLSDWDLQEANLESYVTDMESVVAGAGLDRFPMLAISQGCAVAIAYTIRHPEKVSRLVLHGGYAKGWYHRSSPAELETREAMMTLVRQGWGDESPAFRQVFTSLFFPDATPEQERSFNELQRRSTSPENAVQLLRSFSVFDVSDLLSQVKVPVLVTHCRGDLRVPFDSGRELAAGIPNARFVSLESRNHLMFENEPAWVRFTEEVSNFLAEGDAG